MSSSFRRLRGFYRFKDFIIETGFLPIVLLFIDVVALYPSFQMDLFVGKAILILLVSAFLYSRRRGQEQKRFIDEFSRLVDNYGKLIQSGNPESAIYLSKQFRVEERYPAVELFEQNLTRTGQIIDGWCDSITWITRLFGPETSMEHLVRASGKFNEVVGAYHSYVLRPLIEEANKKTLAKGWLSKFNRFRTDYDEWVREARKFSEGLEKTSGARLLQPEFITEEITSREIG